MTVRQLDGQQQFGRVVRKFLIVGLAALLHQSQHRLDREILDVRVGQVWREVVQQMLLIIAAGQKRLQRFAEIVEQNAALLFATGAKQALQLLEVLLEDLRGGGGLGSGRIKLMGTNRSMLKGPKVRRSN